MIDTLAQWFASHNWAAIVRAGVEILILWAAVYLLLAAFARISAGGKIRGISLMLGIAALSWFIARFFDLAAIAWLLQAAIGVGAVVLVVVFQPELRRLFVRLGGFVPQFGASGGTRVVQPVIDAVLDASGRKLGMLVVIERADRLDDYIQSSPLDCELVSKALVGLFWRGAPFHDGATIIRDGRIHAAGVVLPLSESAVLHGHGGTRHRAALGIAEDTDAVAVVVSEETGALSLAVDGVIRRQLSPTELEAALAAALSGRATRKAMQAYPG